LRKGVSKGQQLFKNETQIIKKTFEEVVEEYLLSAKVKGRAEDTIKTYIHHTNYFIKFIGTNTNCRDITLKTMESYILHLKDRDIKGTTVNSYMQNISPIIKYCIKKGYILEDFTIPVVKVQEEFKEILTEDELYKLLQPPKKKDFISVRVYTCVWLLASTGLRASELRHLKVGNINMVDKVITCNYTKNRRARYLPISSSLYEVFNEYLALRKGEAEDYLFPTIYNEILSRTSLQKGIVKYCHERGVEKSGIHIHRHTFITRSVEKNVSPVLLKSITGHSTFKQLNHYYNSQASSLVEIIDSIAPNLNSKESMFKSKKGGKK
jgi:integrase/recombinase XerD